MSFQLKIQVDTSQVAPAAQGVVTNLDKTSDAAARASDALGKVGTTGAEAGKQAAAGIETAAGAARAAEGDFSGLVEAHARQEAMLRRIKGPWEAYKTDLQAAANLVQADKISTAEYEAELGRLQQRLVSIERYSMSPQLQREVEILDRIQGPMREYQATLQALDALLAQDMIAQAEYNRELEKAEALAARGAAVYGPKQQALQREAEILERLEAPMREYETTLQALDLLLAKGAITLSDYNRELEKTEALAARGMPIYGPTQQVGTSADGAEMQRELQREADILERIQGPMREYEATLRTLDALYAKERLTLTEYNRELERLEQLAMKGAGPMQGPKREAADSIELQRQAEILERIKSPMREYEARLRALHELRAKEVITLQEYNHEIEQAERLVRPKGGGASKGGTGVGDGGEGNLAGQAVQAIAPQFGIVGQTLAGVTAGSVAAAAAAVGLGMKVIELADDYTALTAQVVRFTSAGQSSNEILRQQYDLSKDLHASLEATTQVYVRVRESTNELNLGAAKQLQLTRDIGEAVVASGKSAEAAAGLTQRLGLAFATGAISADDMKQIMRDFPEIGEGFSKALGRSRNELIAMASKGEISAQQIITAFRKMQPEMEARLKAMPETFGQTWQHVKDAVVLAIGDIAEANVNPDLLLQAQAARAYLAHAQAVKELNAEYERNARLEPIIAAAQSRGLNVGGFDRETADKIAAMRITAREAGIEIADAFDEAKSKATLFGTEVEKIKTANASRQIAEDAKRIYDALYGADDILKAQFKHWTDLSDKIEVARKAVERWKAVTPDGVPVPQEQRDLERQIRDAETEQTNARYGKGLVEYKVGLDKARDSLQDWTRAAKEGAVSAEAFRKKTDEVLTTLNDGRLPSAIKLWESMVLPLRDVSDDLRGLTTLFNQGRISVFEYTVEFRKLADSMQQLHRTQLDEYTAPQALLDRMKAATNTNAFGGEASTTLDVGDELAAYRAQRERDAARDVQNSAPLGRTPSVAGRGDVQGAMDAANAYQASDAIRKLNEELERQRQLANEFVAPGVKYEETLKDITGAVEHWGLSEQEASVLRRRAKSEYDEATEALRRVKGPVGEYEAALRKLNEQLADHEISQSKFNEGVRAAKSALLQATGESSTFAGGMQNAWLKLQQDAENFGASVANLVVGDMDKLNEAIVSAANGGEVAWGQMIESMLADLEKLALKMLEIKLLQAAFSLFDGGSGGLAANAATGIANALGSGGGGGAPAVPDAITSASAAPAAIDTVARSAPPPSAYPAPSAAAPAAYPYPATTARRADPAPAASSPPTIVQIINRYDDSLGLAALDKPAGQQRILNTLRANRAAMRTYTGR